MWLLVWHRFLMDPNDQSDPPRWVPYTPPQAGGWDRFWRFLRRLVFPVAVLLFVGGVAGVFYWITEEREQNGSQATTDIVSSNGRVGPEGRAEERGAQLVVQADPERATVRVNGDSVGTTPYMDSTLEAGAYMLSVRAPDYFRADTVVVLEAGRPTRVRVALRSRPDVGEAPSAAADPAPETEQPTSAPSGTASAPSSPSPTPPDPTPTVGALRITSTPEGATVSVGQTERGQTPITVERLPLGPKEVSVTREGYQPWSSQVDVTADTMGEVHAVLQRRTGRLRMLARPWGTLYVNDSLHARESDVWSEVELPVGRHQVTAVHPALGEQTREVEVEAGTETEVVFDLRPE